MIVSVALVEGGESRLARLARQHATTSPARRGDRSYSSPRRIAARPAARPAPDRRRRADRARHCAARAVRRWRRRARSPPAARSRSCASTSAAAKWRPRSRFNPERAEKITSGSTSLPISRAMSISEGSEQRLGDEARIALRASTSRPSASRKAASSSAAGPPRAASMREKIERSARLCAACQRLNGVAVMGEQTLQILGRLRRRQPHRRGEAAQQRDHRARGDILEGDARVCVESSTTPRAHSCALARLAGEASVISSPFSPMRPSASGMTKGFFSVWPGVAGVDCSSVSVRRLASAS